MRILPIFICILSLSYLNASSSYAMKSFDELPFDLKYLVFYRLLENDETSLIRLTQTSKGVREDIRKFKYFLEPIEIGSLDQLEKMDSSTSKWPSKFLNVIFTSPNLSKTEILKCLYHPFLEYTEKVDLSRVTSLSERDRADLENLILPFFEDTDGLEFRSFSPDGSQIVTGGRNSTAVILESRTGLTLQILGGQEDEIESATFCPDGSKLITILSDQHAAIWDIQSGRVLSRLNHRGAGNNSRLRFAAFSPDGTRAITSSNDFVTQIYNVSTGTLVWTLRGQISGFDPAPFSTDGKKVVIITQEREAEIWDLETGIRFKTLRSESGAIGTAKYSPDGKSILTTGNREIFEEHEPNLLQIPSHFFHEVAPELWDGETGEQLWSLKGFSGNIRVASFSQSDSQLITGSNDGTINIWDTESGTLKHTLPWSGEGVRSVAFFPNEKNAVTVSFYGFVMIWDIETGEKIHVERSHSVVPPNAISPDGRKILISHRGPSVRLLNLKRILRKH